MAHMSKQRRRNFAVALVLILAIAVFLLLRNGGVMEFLKKVNWGNTLFSCFNFALVFWAWLRIGKKGDLPINYMKWFLGKEETNVGYLYVVGQVHAAVVFGIFLDLLRTQINFSFWGAFALLGFVLVIWIGKDNQTIHLNQTKELAGLRKYDGMSPEKEEGERKKEIHKLQSQIRDHKRRIKGLRKNKKK